MGGPRCPAKRRTCLGAPQRLACPWPMTAQSATKSKSYWAGLRSGAHSIDVDGFDPLEVLRMLGYPRQLVQLVEEARPLTEAEREHILGVEDSASFGGSGPFAMAMGENVHSYGTEFRSGSSRIAAIHLFA